MCTFKQQSARASTQAMPHLVPNWEVNNELSLATKLIEQLALCNAGFLIFLAEKLELKLCVYSARQ
jgi:hypothetical protein